MVKPSLYYIPLKIENTIRVILFLSLLGIIFLKTIFHRWERAVHLFCIQVFSSDFLTTGIKGHQRNNAKQHWAHVGNCPGFLNKATELIREEDEERERKVLD